MSSKILYDEEVLTFIKVSGLIFFTGPILLEISFIILIK